MARTFRHVSLTRQVVNVQPKQPKQQTQLKQPKQPKRKRRLTLSTPPSEVCLSTVKAMEEFMKTESNAVPEMWLAAVPDEYLSAYDRYPDDWMVFDQCDHVSKKY